MQKHTTALLAALLLTTSALRADPTPAPATQPATAHDFPAFGVHFFPPAGWKRASPTSTDTIAKWVSLDPSGNVAATLLVQFHEIHGSIVDDIRDTNHRITLTSLRNLATFDGQAFWAKGSTPTAASVQEFDARHDNVGYRVTLSRQNPAPPGEDDATMKSFMNAWQFRILEEPWQHPVLNRTPLTIENALLINLPTDARPEPMKNPAPGINLAITNLKTQTIDFRLNAFTRPGPAPTPLALTATLQSHLAPGESLRFTNVGNNRLLSAWAKSDKFTVPMYLAVAIVPLDNTHSAIVTFFTERTEPSVQDAYLTLAQKIILTIQPAPPVPPTTPHPTTTALLN